MGPVLYNKKDVRLRGDVAHILRCRVLFRGTVVLMTALFVYFGLLSLRFPEELPPLLRSSAAEALTHLRVVSADREILQRVVFVQRLPFLLAFSLATVRVATSSLVSSKRWLMCYVPVFGEIGEVRRKLVGHPEIVFVRVEVCDDALPEQVGKLGTVRRPYDTGCNVPSRSASPLNGNSSPASPKPEGLKYSKQ